MSAKQNSLVGLTQRSECCKQLFCVSFIRVVDCLVLLCTLLYLYTSAVRQKGLEINASAKVDLKAPLPYCAHV